MFHVKQIEYRVNTNCELLQFLLEQMPDSSRSKVKELLSHSVCVDGRHVTQYNYPLQRGMVVTIEKVGYKERLKPRDLDIVYDNQGFVYLFVRQFEHVRNLDRVHKFVALIGVRGKWNLHGFQDTHGIGLRCLFH